MAILKDLKKKENRFVRGVVVSSAFILVILFNIIAVAVLKADDIRGLIARMYAGSGSYTDALRYTEDIKNETKRVEKQYVVACVMQENGDHEEAAELFASLGEHLDSADRYLACRYALADSLFRNGAYDEALECFSALGSYSDAKLRQSEVIYAKAGAAAENGDYAQAIMLFLSLGDYSDSYTQAYNAAYSVTGNKTKAEEMLSNGGMTAEAMELMVAIAERRTELPPCSIAAGNYHTVVLNSDGTVSACGDNSSGQCDVSGWKNIIQVHAGAKHTVGLRADGTVVAAGDNTYGQCNVDGWAGVTELAVNDYNTLALLKDGTIFNAGFNSYDSIERIDGVSHIFAGGYSAAAVTDSSYIASHKSCGLQPGQKIVQAVMNTGYAAALQVDGSCVFSADAVDGEWNRMVWLDAGPTALIGVDLDGSIHFRFFRQSDTIKLTADKAILQCSAGSGHFVFLAADGEVIVLGDDSYGQCELSGEFIG